MRIDSAVTTVSWIPSEAIGGTMKLPFALKMTHYDQPPPDRLDDLEALREADRFRFANVLSAERNLDEMLRIAGDVRRLRPHLLARHTSPKNAPGAGAVGSQLIRGLLDARLMQEISVVTVASFAAPRIWVFHMLDNGFVFRFSGLGRMGRQ